MVVEEWRRRWLTVIGQQGCSRWLDNTVAAALLHAQWNGRREE